jgi:hypothetical protein
MEETQDKRDLQRIQSGCLTTYGYIYDPHGHESSVQEDAVNGIISQHRETLKTFTYLTTVSHISFKMFGPLPSLRDLTIVSLCHSSTFNAVHSRPVNSNTQFPRLERLHLSHFDTKHLFGYDEFRRVAPNLTHLRISGQECYPQYEKLPLRTMVLLQPTQIGSWGQDRQLSHLRGILSVPSYKERTVLLEPGHWEHGRYEFFDALLDWLDVSAGGNAFWGQDSTVTVDDLAASYR